MSTMASWIGLQRMYSSKSPSTIAKEFRRFRERSESSTKWEMPRHYWNVSFQIHKKDKPLFFKSGSRSNCLEHLAFDKIILSIIESKSLTFTSKRNFQMPFWRLISRICDYCFIVHTSSSGYTIVCIYLISVFQNSLQKYGSKNFRYTLLEICSFTWLKIRKYNTQWRYRESIKGQQLDL